MRLPETVTQVAPEPGTLWIDLGSFPTYEFANMQRAVVAQLGATIVNQTHGRGESFKVTIGPIPDVAQADRLLDQAVASGISRCADRGAVKETADADPTPGVAGIDDLGPNHLAAGRAWAQAQVPLKRPAAPHSATAKPRGSGHGEPAPTGSPADTPLGPVDTAARWAVIVDYNTGATVLNKDADEEMPPSSMTKLMTAYIVYSRLADGQDAADRHAAGQRKGLADGRLEDVRPDRLHGLGRGPDPRHDRPVRQRCLHRAGRVDLGVGGTVRRADEPDRRRSSA